MTGREKRKEKVCRGRGGEGRGECISKRDEGGDQRQNVAKVLCWVRQYAQYEESEKISREILKFVSV